MRKNTSKALLLGLLLLGTLLVQNVKAVCDADTAAAAGEGTDECDADQACDVDTCTDCTAAFSAYDTGVTAPVEYCGTCTFLSTTSNANNYRCTGCASGYFWTAGAAADVTECSSCDNYEVGGHFQCTACTAGSTAKAQVTCTEVDEDTGELSLGQIWVDAETGEADFGGTSSELAFYLVTADGSTAPCPTRTPGCMECGANTAAACSSSVTGWVGTTAPVQCTYDALCSACTADSEATTCTDWWGKSDTASLVKTYKDTTANKIRHMYQIDEFASYVAADGTSVSCPEIGFYMVDAAPKACYPCLWFNGALTHAIECSYDADTKALSIDECEDGWAVNGAGTMCISCGDAHAVSCTLSDADVVTSVDECEDGYAVKTATTCGACPTGADWCEYTDGAVSDVECDDGYEIMDSGLACKSCGTGADSCDLSDADAITLVYCDDGYYRSSATTCAVIGSAPGTGCLNVNDDVKHQDDTYTAPAAGDCDECKAGYVFNEDTNACVACPDNALTCALTTRTASVFPLICNEGYYWQDAECKTAPAHCIKPFSYPWKTSVACLECDWETHFSSGNVCEACPTGVTECWNLGGVVQARACASGYSLVAAVVADDGTWSQQTCVADEDDDTSAFNLAASFAALLFALLVALF